MMEQTGAVNTTAPANVPEPPCPPTVSKYTMIKILLCGRGVHGIITQFIEHHLAQQPDMEIHDHCTPEDMPDRVPLDEPDVVLMVVGIPTDDDTAKIAGVRAKFPACPIIAVSLSTHADVAVKPLLEAGATIVLAAENALDLPKTIREMVTSGVGCGAPV